jgi:hypothetical protein
MDEDAAVAAVDLIGRTGAREVEVGYLHEDVPAEDAGWHAHAKYRGARVGVEGMRGPVEAVEALARRLLTGAKCRCGALVALSDAGAVAYPGQPLADGTVWDETAIVEAGQCRWTRMGRRWVSACPEPDGREKVAR